MGTRAAASVGSGECRGEGIAFDAQEGDVLEALGARARFYRMLASLFYRELGAEKIAELARIDLASLADEGSAMAAGLGLMSASLSRASARTRQELAADYASVFLAAGSYEDRKAVPYESVFTSPDGLLMQDARDDVLAWYRKEGFALDPAVREPEDHLSFELEFMAELAERAEAALREGDAARARQLCEASAEFLRMHILNWIEPFADAVEACAESRFYRGLARVAVAWARDDAEMLAELGAMLGASQGARFAAEACAWA